MNKILIMLAIVFFSVITNEAYASCIAEVDYGLVYQEAELVFKGTVTSIDNSAGPQLVYFDVHEVAKGTVINDRYVLENFEIINQGNGSYTLSSLDVGYKVGTTYNVYVVDGQTSLCTTKPIVSPIFTELSTLNAYEQLNHRLSTDSEFAELVQTEVVGFGIDESNQGIFIVVDPDYANRENFERYEEIFRDTIGDDISITFEVRERGNPAERKDPDFILLILIPILALSAVIYYLSRKRK